MRRHRTLMPVHRGLILVALVSILCAATAAASTGGYSKTMVFKTKLCQASVRDLPNTARLAGTELIFGSKKTPDFLSFICFYGGLNSLHLGEAEDGGRLGNANCTTSTKPVHQGSERLPRCKPWVSTPIPGTKVNWFFLGEENENGYTWAIDYVLKLHDAFVLVDYSPEPPPHFPTPAKAPRVPWIITMLQHSTFHVQPGAGGNPNNPLIGEGSEPQDWTLPRL